MESSHNTRSPRIGFSQGSRNFGLIIARSHLRGSRDLLTLPGGLKCCIHAIWGQQCGLVHSHDMIMANWGSILVIWTLTCQRYSGKGLFEGVCNPPTPQQGLISHTVGIRGQQRDGAHEHVQSLIIGDNFDHFFRVLIFITIICLTLTTYSPPTYDYNQVPMHLHLRNHICET